MSLEIKKNYDLKGLNTFGVKALASFFVEVQNEDDVKDLWATNEFKENKKLFLGGGSNILFIKDWDGIVVLNKIKGIEVIKEDANEVLVRSMGGEVWHDLVEFTVSRSWWGLENLSSIPGSVGGAPMQNIGAYGAELKEVLHSVEAYEVETGSKKVFENNAYVHGYRESIFKGEFRGKFFITAVVLKLSKVPKINTKYKSLREYLEKNNIEVKTPKDIGSAVTEIRKEKLPDPKIINNAGSFFKNVLVDENKFTELQKLHPDMPYFKDGDMIKIPSGWLIEACGFKGKRVGDVGVYAKHALVLVNYGNATGNDIKELAEEITAKVEEKFGLKLVPEVNFI